MRKWFEVNSERILQILLDRSGATWNTLFKELGIPLDAPGSVCMDVYNHLYFLADAGLIRVDGADDGNEAKRLHYMISGLRSSNAKIRASDNYLKIKRALQAHCRGASLEDRFTLTVSPLFGSPSNLSKQTDVFVLMPFSDNFRPIYTDHIVPAINSAGLTVSRADEYLTTNPIMSDVWAAIVGCGVVVAECTGRNSNVFYEIGVAHTLGKPVVLITQNSDDIPSDVRQIKYIRYAYTPPGMKQFENSLIQTVNGALGVWKDFGKSAGLGD
jgi:hypothetical protein